MLDKIFHLFFDKDDKLDNKTIVKKREINSLRSYSLVKKENKQVELTCLSKYFTNRTGLNVNERKVVN